MSDDNDPRKQAEEDAQEDLELGADDAEDVRGGDTAGSIKWGNVGK